MKHITYYKYIVKIFKPLQCNIIHLIINMFLRFFDYDVQITGGRNLKFIYVDLVL